VAESTAPDPLPTTEDYYVYLMTGEVRVVEAPCELHVLADRIVISYEGHEMAEYSRDSVFLCSHTPMSPPVLF
jgi:hypothetical protein